MVQGAGVAPCKWLHLSLCWLLPAAVQWARLAQIVCLTGFRPLHRFLLFIPVSVGVSESTAHAQAAQRDCCLVRASCSCCHNPISTAICVDWGCFASVLVLASALLCCQERYSWQLQCLPSDLFQLLAGPASSPLLQVRRHLVCTVAGFKWLLCYHHSCSLFLVVHLRPFKGGCLIGGLPFIFQAPVLSIPSPLEGCSPLEEC